MVWESPPLTNITVTTADACPNENPDIVFGRHWYGTEVGCDCIGNNREELEEDRNRMIPK
jgi:hypothetical protein